MTDPRPSHPDAPIAGPTAPDAPVGGARVLAPDFLTELFRNPLDVGYAEAAARKAARGDDRPLARRAGFAVRMIALVATGLLLAVAYQQTVAAQPESSKVRDGLVHDVRQRQRDDAALQKQADALRSRVAKLRDAVLVDADAQALRRLEAVVGAGAVVGGGAVVTLSDGPAPTDPVTGALDPEPDHYLGRVFDADLRIIANELWRDGAEAIAINGQRLTATSTIRTAGSAILVDFVPLAQPYQIAAIGPSDLAGRFNASAVGSEYRRLRDTYGMHVAVAKRDRMRLPAAADVELRYATPATPSPRPSSPPATRSASPRSSSPNPTPPGGR